MRAGELRRVDAPLIEREESLFKFPSDPALERPVDLSEEELL